MTTSIRRTPSRPRSVAMLIVFLAMTLGRLRLGASITAISSGTWYHGLDKPSFTPPDWVFVPIWAALYISMAIAAWRVWRRIGAPGRNTALVLFTLQLFLNLLWSVLFFGYREIGWSFAEILVLLLTILLTLVQFDKVDRGAALWFMPYVLWVGFAALLDGEIFWRN